MHICFSRVFSGFSSWWGFREKTLFQKQEKKCDRCLLNKIIPRMSLSVSMSILNFGWGTQLLKSFDNGSN